MSTPVADTVQHAALTPDKEQPYAALGLKPDEYEQIKAILGRRPTSGELAMYSVMWSEHCSYKSSKIYLRRFGQKVSDEMKERLMVGMGQNAGVVDVGEGWAVTFKVESHNHPSYIEPFQGAATGVGGIVRDIISMGARPVAVMDQLRFGAIDHPDTPRVVHGVTSGISFYANCLGLPNIGGETVFDAVYQGNPLVNALAVGVIPAAANRLAPQRSARWVAVLHQIGARQLWIALQASVAQNGWNAMHPLNAAFGLNVAQPHAFIPVDESNRPQFRVGECVRHFAALFLHQLGNCAFWVVLKAIKNWAERASLWCHAFGIITLCIRLLLRGRRCGFCSCWLF